MFSFAWPWILLLLPLPWLARRLLPPAPPAASGTLYAPFAPALAGAVSASAGTHSARRGMWWFAIFCWALLVLAAARPQWFGEALDLPASGRNLMLAVDISGSMEIADLEDEQTTRLMVVKQVAGDFIKRREGDRLGLILFGTQAYVQSPLSFDRATVAQLLDEAVIGLAGQQTAIGDAIGMAIKRLRPNQTKTEDESVLILLTDGTATAGEVRPDQAAELAAQTGLKVYTIGIGGKARRVRGIFGTQVVNPAADLDEGTLKHIAEVTGGRYFRATDRKDLEEIYQTLDELEPVAGESQVVRPTTPLYPWPLGAAFIASLVAVGSRLWKSRS